MGKPGLRTGQAARPHHVMSPHLCYPQVARWRGKESLRRQIYYLMLFWSPNLKMEWKATACWPGNCWRHPRPHQTTRRQFRNQIHCSSNPGTRQLRLGWWSFDMARTSWQRSKDQALCLRDPKLWPKKEARYSNTGLAIWCSFCYSWAKKMMRCVHFMLRKSSKRQR